MIIMKRLSCAAMALSLVFGAIHANVVQQIKSIDYANVLKYTKAVGAFAGAGLTAAPMALWLTKDAETACLKANLISEEHAPIVPFFNRPPAYEIEGIVGASTCVASRLFTIGVLAKWGADYIKEAQKAPSEQQNKSLKKVADITKATLCLGGAALGSLAFIPIIERGLVASKVTNQKVATPAIKKSIGHTVLKTFICVTGIASRLFTTGVAIAYGVKALKDEKRKVDKQPTVA